METHPGEPSPHDYDNGPKIPDLYIIVALVMILIEEAKNAYQKRRSGE